MTPTSHKESIFAYNETGELKLEMATPVPVTFSTSLTRHADDGKKHDVSDYVFKAQTDKNVQFGVRFLQAGNTVTSLYFQTKTHKTLSNSADFI